MSKKIVVKHTDKSVSIIWSNPEIYGESEGMTPYSQCKALQRYINPNHKDYIGTTLEWYLAEETTIPTDESHPLYFDSVANELSIDTQWAEILMGKSIIIEKEINYCRTELTTELAKETPDTLKCLNLRNKIDRLQAREYTDLEIYQMALSNLSTRAEIAKPNITAILNAKIAELTPTP